LLVLKYTDICGHTNDNCKFVPTCSAPVVTCHILNQKQATCNRLVIYNMVNFSVNIAKDIPTHNTVILPATSNVGPYTRVYRYAGRLWEFTSSVCQSICL